MGRNLHVDLKDAEAILNKAYDIAIKSSAITDSKFIFINTILNGSHLTFKYILFTELLAKATNEKINTLCLQSGSKLDGSYDARSLCHKVIVPFEKTTLDKILGGSNEPFLNKPARFPDINPSNPVRAGKDRELLFCLYKNLPNINTKEIAFQALVYFLQAATKKKEERSTRKASYIKNSNNDRLVLMDFLHSLLRENKEGEALTLVVANVYNLLYGDDKKISVEVHPVNQCGASSKEISDLDIKEEGCIFLANELKDKHFNESDICHAADKVIEASGTQMFFIVGKDGDYVGNQSLDKIVEDYHSKGMIVKIVTIDEFLDSIFPLCKDASLSKIIEYSSVILKENKFKKETEEYFYQTVDLVNKL